MNWSLTMFNQNCILCNLLKSSLMPFKWIGEPGYWSVITDLMKNCNNTFPAGETCRGLIPKMLEGSTKCERQDPVKRFHFHGLSASLVQVIWVERHSLTKPIFRYRFLVLGFGSAKKFQRSTCKDKDQELLVKIWNTYFELKIFLKRAKKYRRELW